MTEDVDAPKGGWFADLAPGDVDGGARSIREGEAAESQDWPARAVESGVADAESAYYDWLHDATLQAARDGVREQSRADDRQLIHAVRSMDDCRRTANELAERVAEWGSDRLDDGGAGLDYARTVAEMEPTDSTMERLVSLAQRCVALVEEADELRDYVERMAPEVAPNLSAMAGPVLATRLIALAGGLEALAKQPSGTVQVLGAEDALFAHLRGDGPSPKHGVIYTHEYVRGIDPEHRGSAARAVAGKFAIAARVDHYSGDRRPALDAELDDRIATIRARSEPDGDEGADQGGGDHSKATGASDSDPDTDDTDGGAAE